MSTKISSIRNALRQIKFLKIKKKKEIKHFKREDKY